MPTGDEGTKCSSCLLPYNNKDRTPKVWQCMLLCSKQMYNVHIFMSLFWISRVNPLHPPVNRNSIFVYRVISTMTNLTFELNQRTWNIIQKLRHNLLWNQSHTCFQLIWWRLLCLDPALLPHLLPGVPRAVHVHGRGDHLPLLRPDHPRRQVGPHAAPTNVNQIAHFLV